jgi:hypothetical protein
LGGRTAGGKQTQGYYSNGFKSTADRFAAIDQPLMRGAS